MISNGQKTFKKRNQEKKIPEKSRRTKNDNNVSSFFCKKLENDEKMLNVENALGVFYKLAENVFFSFFADHFLVSKIR